MASHYEIASSNRSFYGTNTSPMLTTLPDYRVQLNNYLQANGGTQRLSWGNIKDGPEHRPNWTAHAYRLSPNRLTCFRLTRFRSRRDRVRSCRRQEFGAGKGRSRSSGSDAHSRFQVYTQLVVGVTSPVQHLCVTSAVVSSTYPRHRTRFRLSKRVLSWTYLVPPHAPLPASRHLAPKIHSSMLLHKQRHRYTGIESIVHTTSYRGTQLVLTSAPTPI